MPYKRYSRSLPKGSYDHLKCSVVNNQKDDDRYLLSGKDYLAECNARDIREEEKYDYEARTSSRKPWRGRDELRKDDEPFEYTKVAIPRKGMSGRSLADLDARRKELTYKPPKEKKMNIYDELHGGGHSFLRNEEDMLKKLDTRFWRYDDEKDLKGQVYGETWRSVDDKYAAKRSQAPLTWGEKWKLKKENEAKLRSQRSAQNCPSSDEDDFMPKSRTRTQNSSDEEMEAYFKQLDQRKAGKKSFKEIKNRKNLARAIESDEDQDDIRSRRQHRRDIEESESICDVRINRYKQKRRDFDMDELDREIMEMKEATGYVERQGARQGSSRYPDDIDHDVYLSSEEDERPTKTKSVAKRDLLASTLPNFDVTLRNVNVKEGRPAKFTCAITSRPPPQIFWSKDDMLIQNDDKYAYSNISGFAELLINSCDFRDAGVYKCTAINEVGENCEVALLHVEGARDPDYF